MRKIIRLILFLLVFGLVKHTPHAESAFERLPLVPQVAARGGTSVGWSEGKSAFLWNPAAEISSSAILSATYSKPFGIDDLAEGLLSYSHTIANSGSLGLGWSRLNATGYHEDRQSVAFSWGKELGRVGIRLDRFGIGIDGFGDRAALGVSVGGVLKIHPSVRMGVAANSINRPKMPRPLPRSWEIGIGLQAIPELLLVTDLRKVDDRAVQIRAGGELLVSRHFSLRAGMHNQPWEIVVGWGIQLQLLVIDYAWVNHSRLDGTHQIAVGWRFERL